VFFSLSHFVLSTSNQYETAFAIVIKQQSPQIEIHQLKNHLQHIQIHLQTTLKQFLKIL
jgi:hypothetical protein